MDFSKSSSVNNRDFNLTSSSSTTFKTQDFHAHTFYEILYFKAGDVQYYMEDNSYSLVPGDVLIIPPNTMHRPVVIDQRRSYDRMVMELSQDYCRRLMQRIDDCFLWKDFKPCRISVDHLGASQFIDYMNRLMELPEDTRGYLERDSICTLLLLLIDQAFSRNLTASETSPQQIHEILRYINAHYTQTLHLDEIADRFYLSKFYLLRQFKSYTNCTIHDYILTKRIQLAKALLTDGMSSGEVGDACGFASYASFYQAFHKRTGFSPSSYTSDIAEAEQMQTHQQGGL